MIALQARDAPIDPHLLVRTILSERRFVVAIPATRRTLWQMFWDWVHGLWARLADAIASRVHIGNFTAVVLGDLLVIALIALVAIVAVRLLLASRLHAQKHSVTNPLAAAEDPELLHARSIRLAQQGDYRAAIALIFRAAIVRLERLGLVRGDPSTTVNEYRRALHLNERNVAAIFEGIARAFTAAFYAEHAVNQAHWLSAHDAYVRLPEPL